MNRPAFNRFAEGDPNEDYNRRMRQYIIYLEERANKCFELEAKFHNAAYIAEELHSTQEQNYELSKSMKVLRSQLRKMFKESKGADQKKNV